MIQNIKETNKKRMEEQTPGREVPNKRGMAEI
jgi:hypothetical protein